MGILQLPVVLPAQVGFKPATKKMVTTDSLATITAAGYLNSYDLQSNPISPTDVLQVIYLYNQQTNSGIYSEFTVSINNGVITLTQFVNTGNVLLPVTSGDFPVFNGTTGQIKDSNSSPTSAGKPFVVVTAGGWTVGHIPQYLDTNGTLGLGLPTSQSSGASFVVSSAGAITPGHILKAGDANGTVADGGMTLIKTVNLPNAGDAGNPVTTIVDLTVATTSLVLVSLVNATTAPTAILQIKPGTGQFVITFAADPGADSTISYLVIN